MIVAGAAGFAKELLEVLTRDYEFQEIHFFDDLTNNSPSRLYGKFKIITDIVGLREVLEVDNKFVLGIGRASTRYKLSVFFKKFGAELTTTISKYARVGSYNTNIGYGCNIMDGVIVTNDINIDEGCLINLNCTVGHDSSIGKYCDIAPDVNISGKCTIGNYCEIGTGSVIIPGITIGENVVVGAGSIITKDIPPNSLVVGVPGRIIKTIPSVQSWKINLKSTM